MRHIVNLVLGEGTVAFSQALFKYIRQYDVGEAAQYMQTLLLGDGDTGTCITPIVSCNPSIAFCSVLDNLFACRQDNTQTYADEEELRTFFVKLYRKTVTIQRKGETSFLTLNMMLPLYEASAWVVAKRVIEAVNNLDFHFTIDIIGLSRDLRGIYSLTNGEQTEMNLQALEKSIVNAIVAMEKNEERLVHRFLYMQNCNSQGVSLNLDTEALARVLGEFCILTEERYDAVFPVADLEITPVTTFGLSVVWLDKYYYLYYILRRSYIHLLEREMVDQKRVDVAKVMPVAKERLSGHVNVFGDFFRKEVSPRLKQSKMDETILSEISPLLSEQIDQLTKRFTDFIHDEKFSLPEKKAALACLIGLDDELIEGYALVGEELTLDDCGNDALKFFVEENNRLVHVLTDAEGKPVKDDDGNPVYVGGILHDCIVDGGKVTIPLQELKRLRSAMKDSTTYIRNKEEEMQQISLGQHEQHNREKRLTTDGFMLNGHVYRMMDKVEERPLEETYVPHKVEVRSVDLREHFGPVGQQGSVGTCTAFAMTGIFEYMLQRVGDETRLSPAFLYYNCAHRDNDGHLLDKGCSLFDAIASLETKGLCKEELFPYDSIRLMEEKPPQEAFDDAKQRLVLKAMNVELNHAAIVSALADGYPVAIILRIFNSFADNDNGFVYSPTEVEMAEKEKSLHSMVICGFSEDEKVYIVRNSWGSTFGDNGYCYIPFSYIENAELCSSLVIITEVSGAEKTLSEGNENKTSVEFDMMDSSIQYSILHILVDEQKLCLKHMQERYKILRHAFLKLNQSACIPSIRKQICDGGRQRMEFELARLENRRQKFVDYERQNELDAMKNKGNKLKWRMAGTIVLLALLLGVTFYFQRFIDWIDSNFNQICIVTISIVLLTLILFWWWWDHKSKKLKGSLNDRAAEMLQNIKKKKTEIAEFVLKSHVAGMVCDAMSGMRGDIQHSYNLLSSFVGNLSTWLDEERSEVDKMSILSQQPFISVLDRDVLDRYIQEHMEELTKDIRLYDFFDNYALEETAIEQFKNAGIKQVLMQKIEQSLEGFSLFRYLERPDTFPFLPEGERLADTLFSQLVERSDCFAQIKKINIFDSDSDDRMQVLLAHTADQNEKARWNALYPPYFQLCPSSDIILSPFKIVLLRKQAAEVNELVALREKNRKNNGDKVEERGA